MFRLFTALLGLTQIAPDEARRIHARFAGIILTTIFLIIVVGLGSNLAGYKVVNLILSPIFALATIIFWTRPANLAIVTGSGVVAGTVYEGIPKTTMKFITLYIKAVGHIWLWGSIIFLFLGTIPAKENPMAVFGILSACAVIGLASTIWEMGMLFYRKFVYKYAIVMLVLFALALVPRYTWIKLTGYDIQGAVVPSETEAAISEIEKAEMAAEEKKNLEILNPILEKIEDGKPLMEWERKFLEEMKEKRYTNSLPGAIQRAIESIDSTDTGAVPTPAQYEYAPTPAPAPEQYVAPAPQPEPTKATAPSILGEWKLHWGNGEMVTGKVVSAEPLKIICIYRDNTGGKLILTGNRKDALSLEYEGEWTFEAFDSKKVGKFHLNFNEKMAEGSMDDKILIAEKT